MRAVAKMHFHTQKQRRFDRIEKLFPNASDLVDALENGWSSIPELSTRQLAPVAFRALAVIDVEQARTLAKEIVALSAKRGDANASAYLKPVKAEARAVLTRDDTAEDVAAAIALMRKEIPKEPHFMLHNSLEREPSVRWFRERSAKKVHDVIRDALVELTGRPPKLKKLSDADQVFAYALTLALEPHADESDRELLFHLWTDSAGFILLDHGRVMRWGAAGKAFMASLFGRDSKTQYAEKEQSLAAIAQFDLDPKKALAITKKLVAVEDRGWLHEMALAGLFEHLGEGKPRKEWVPVLRRAQHHPDAYGYADWAAITTLVKWKQSGATMIVLDRLEKQQVMVEVACDLLQRAKDKSVRTRLEAYLAQVPLRRKRDRKLVQECIDALSR